MKVALILLLLIANLLTLKTVTGSEKYALSARAGQQVAKAFEFYELGEIDNTLEMIAKIRPRSAFDKAYINRFQGNLYWEKGNEQLALSALQVAVNENALSEHEQNQSERMLADLYLNQHQTKNAIFLYKQLIEKVPSEDLYKHLALAYYQKKSWQDVVDATARGINLSSEFNQSIHILQLSALFELQDYRQANTLLVKLTEHDAQTKRWWMQLASTYQLVKQDKKALATYEQAYQLGFLESSNEIKRLANFRASLGAPYQAALLLESAITSGKLQGNVKNYQQLAQFWQAAREHDKAQQYWGKSAELSGAAKHYFAQAQLLQLLGRHEQMLRVLAAIKSDDIALQGKVAITQVQSLFALKKYSQAKQIAKQLTNNPDNKEHALQWVKLLESREADAKQFAI